MPHTRARFGTVGEDIAAEYLREKGYRVLERNVRTRVGELDLVCGKGREVIFVEVKTRGSHAYGTPQEAITRAKQHHLIRASQMYMASHRELQGAPYRIDVVAITWCGSGAPVIVHIPSAVGL